jgi:hypothetical protein
MPNTYTFTKALAESAVSKESDKLPIAVVRPSLSGFPKLFAQKPFFNLFFS